MLIVDVVSVDKLLISITAPLSAPPMDDLAESRMFGEPIAGLNSHSQRVGGNALAPLYGKRLGFPSGLRAV